MKLQLPQANTMKANAMLLMRRWRAKALDGEFRAARARLRVHPGWDPALFPGKYLPKKPPAGTNRAVSAASR